MLPPAPDEGMQHRRDDPGVMIHTKIFDGINSSDNSTGTSISFDENIPARQNCSVCTALLEWRPACDCRP